MQTLLLRFNWEKTKLGGSREWIHKYAGRDYETLIRDINEHKTNHAWKMIRKEAYPSTN